MSAREEPLASVLLGIRREIGAPPAQARPMELRDVREAVAACPDTPAGLRDRALILLGFAGAFRRSELVGLAWSEEEDGTGYLVPAPEGLRVILRRSKTNQLGAREEVAVCHGAYAATCPVRALEEWAEAITAATGRSPAGPVFRAVDRHGRLSDSAMDGGSVARILRRSVERGACASGLRRPSRRRRAPGCPATPYARGL